MRRWVSFAVASTAAICSCRSAGSSSAVPRLVSLETRSVSWSALYIGQISESELLDARDEERPRLSRIVLADRAMLTRVEAAWRRATPRVDGLPDSLDVRLVAVFTFTDGTRHTVGVDWRCAAMSRDGVLHKLDPELFRLLVTTLREDVRDSLRSKFASDSCRALL